MTDRREFLKCAAAAGLAAYAPLSIAKDRQLPTRLIPGSDEALPIVGLGNSRVFAEGDIEASKAVLETFLAHGGAYVDVSGSSRTSAPPRRPFAGVVPK